MFHVERIMHQMINRSVIFVLCFTIISCITTKQRIEIPDLLIVENGREILGHKNLHAFVFENNQKNIPFDQFIVSAFNLNNYAVKEVNVIIINEEFKLLFYDNDEFEKYIGSSNFYVKNLEPASAKIGNQPSFIAISVINNRNEDCLQPNSLYRNIIINYLKVLKTEYLNK